MHNDPSGKPHTFYHQFFSPFRRRIFYAIAVKRGVPLIRLGSERHSCAWSFCPDVLSKNSIVISGGVGKDITFEHGLVEKFGCNVILLDPSPTGIETMSLPGNQIPQFRYLPVGLAGKPCSLRLSAPLDPVEGSWIPVQAREMIEVQCLDIRSVMNQCGCDSIDLLKLDIEGPEYDVLDSILDLGIPVRQVLVEYHHGLLPGYTISQTMKSIFKMRKHGYKLIFGDGNNHTFLRM
jgi:FkbM family methyltransferase